jgi:4'-phosphopantetheinyl transferase EntD
VIVALEQLLTLFPPTASFAIADSGMDAPLWPEEETFLRNAVAKRRREFALGRAAARAALAGLDIQAAPLPANADRTPAWPAGVTGSITHCEGFCGAVVARTRDIESIGFDAEPAGPLPQGTQRMICGEQEVAHFSALPAIAGLDWPKLAFSGKEAFYKCFYPVTHTPIYFRDVTLRFTVTGDRHGEFKVAPAASDKAAAFLDRAVQGRWRLEDGLVFTSFVLTAG